MSKLSNDCPEGIRALAAKADKVFNVGEFVMVKAGYMIPGAVTTGAIVRGTCAQYLDTTGLSDGDRSVYINLGSWDGRTFDVPNSGSDAVTQAMCGVGYCYVSDAYEVAGTDGTGTRSVAGVPVRLKQNGTIVEVAVLPLHALPDT